jgi:hypothetical protein
MKSIRLKPIGAIPRLRAPIEGVQSGNSVDAPTTRETAFEKIRLRLPGAALAGESIHGS